MWSQLHRREVSRVRDTRSRTPGALRKSGCKWRRCDKRNFCHNVGHAAGGDGQVVRLSPNGCHVPDSDPVADHVQDSARDAVREAARRRPETVALIAGETSLTWADLDRRVDVAARKLGAMTAGAGERVAIVLGNTIDFAVIYFGVLRAGLVAVPLNPGYTADELGFAIGDSGAAVVVGAPAEQERLRMGDARSCLRARGTRAPRRG